MFTFLGRKLRHCDGVSRRSFLAAGSLGLAGWTLADLLRAEDAVGLRGSPKAIINVHLDGGPPHHETIDPKPDAPAEIRGPFAPLATSLPGVFVSELMPQVARLADRFVFVRSLVGSAGKHDAFQCQSGYDDKNLAAIGGRPAIGSVVSRLLGGPHDSAPAFVDLMQGRPLVRNSARPGFLGPAYQPFRPDISEMFPRELEDGMKRELAAKGEHHTLRLELDAALADGRLDDRRALLGRLDRLRRDIDQSGMMDALDRFQQQAVGLLTSGRFAAALDLSQEDPRVVERYTAPGASDDLAFYTSEGPESARKFLLARRLIEAGVRCVSLSISDFDTHSKNFPRMQQLAPIVDHGLATLVTDLEERGLLDDVAIVAWGEFGRTPKVNANGGRDHWPQVGPALLAGGGLRTGQVIGATDRLAASVASRPVSYQDIFATLLRTLGIDARRTTIPDLRGRPQFILDDGQPLPELI